MSSLSIKITLILYWLIARPGSGLSIPGWHFLWRRQDDGKYCAELDKHGICYSIQFAASSTWHVVAPLTDDNPICCVPTNKSFRTWVWLAPADHERSLKGDKNKKEYDFISSAGEFRQDIALVLHHDEWHATGSKGANNTTRISTGLWTVAKHKSELRSTIRWTWKEERCRIKTMLIEHITLLNQQIWLKCLIKMHYIHNARITSWQSIVRQLDKYTMKMYRFGQTNAVMKWCVMECVFMGGS